MINLSPVTEPQVHMIYPQAFRNEVNKLAAAYKVCYSEKPALEVVHEVNASEGNLEYLMERMKTEHTSPLEHISFTFAISDVSRNFSHQFVRTRVGFSVSQQSQRYVVNDNEFRYVLPHGLSEEEELRFKMSVANAVTAYEYAVKNGVNGEDARALLPSCAATSMLVTINYAALLHMADNRLCTLAQREYRMVVSGMRSQIVQLVPELGEMIQPKCGAHRQGFCDESYKDWEACPLGKGVRPHKLVETGA